MNGDNAKHLEKRIIDLKESFEREAQQLNSRFDEFRHAFGTQANRLERQRALLQTGSRWSNRINQWAESVDAT